MQEKELILTCHVAVDHWENRTGDIQEVKCVARQYNHPEVRNTTHDIVEDISPSGDRPRRGICRSRH